MGTSSVLGFGQNDLSYKCVLCTVKLWFLVTMQVLWKPESILRMRIMLQSAWNFDRNMILQAEKCLE